MSAPSPQSAKFFLIIFFVVLFFIGITWSLVFQNLALRNAKNNLASKYNISIDQVIISNMQCIMPTRGLCKMFVADFEVSLTSNQVLGKVEFNRKDFSIISESK